MAFWYYRAAGAEHGPVSDDRLRELAYGGAIGADSAVLPVGTMDWVVLAAVEDRLGLVRAPTGGYLAPGPSRPNVTPPAPSPPSPAAPSSPADDHRAPVRRVPPPPPPSLRPPPLRPAAPHPPTLRTPPPPPPPPAAPGPPAVATGASGPGGMHPGYPLARYGQRVGAFLLDGLVTGVVILLLCVPFHAIRFTNGGGVDSLEATGAAIVISFAMNFVYATVMHGWRGQTVGKLALGIAVADAEHGRGIGYPRAALRYLVTFVLSLPFFFLVPALIDHLAPLWDPRRQAWHDRVARSVVVDVRG